MEERGLTWAAKGTPVPTWQSGEYYEKNKEAKTNPQADDPELAKELWERSMAMLGLREQDLSIEASGER